MVRHCARHYAAAQTGGDVTLLVQHHFFDGMTDCHIMLVAKSGDGDFVAKLKVIRRRFPRCRWCAFTAR